MHVNGMSNPLVSVIIPAYNVTRYIKQAIDSALNQQFTDCEIIVINDNCPDTVNLELALNSYGSKIRYLKHPVNSGPAATRNTGIIAARGELVAFLDGDDIWESRYLETQIGVLRRHPEAHVVYCDALIIGDTKDVGKHLMEMSPSNGPVTLLSLFRQQVQVLISVLIRKEMLFKVGLLDPAPALRASEDFDLWVRIVKAGGKIIYHREQLFRYRRHAESLSSDGVRIGQSALAVASKTLKRTDLSNEERFAIEDTAARWRSDLSLEQGKNLCF